MDDNKRKRCVVCGGHIPADRLELAPNTVTCRRQCSRIHTVRLRQQAKQAWRDRQRAQREATPESG